MRGIVEQIAKGLRAFHRMEMLHQDLRPDNIMIDKHRHGEDHRLRLDPGGRRRREPRRRPSATDILGTAQYTAPEYFLGEGGTPRSDLFSLGVIAYQMLTGRLPYGARDGDSTHARAAAQRCATAPRSTTSARSRPGSTARCARRCIPIPTSATRSCREFVFDLRHPNESFSALGSAPLIERNPLLFWKALSFVLALVVLVLLAMLHGMIGEGECLIYLRGHRGHRRKFA